MCEEGVAGAACGGFEGEFFCAGEGGDVDFCGDDGEIVAAGEGFDEGGVGGGGTADNNIFMTSFRYYPF